MDAESKTLRTAFAEAEAQRNRLDQFGSSMSPTFQEHLLSTIKGYEESLRIAAQVSLFSSNETLEDVNTGDLQFMLINYDLAELILKKTGNDRKENLHQARNHYEAFLRLLDSYDMLSKSDVKLFETYTEDRNAFSTAPVVDASSRRTAKVARFREEKELKSKIEFLHQRSTAIEEDSEALRQLQLQRINLDIHKTFDALESIAQELKILEMAPPSSGSRPEPPTDRRQRNGHTDGYSERLDGPLSQLSAHGGPLLDKGGKPLQPFTLLDRRTQLQQGVFRPDHSLPTMTIDEYLEEERRRGGIIEGGGPQSGVREEVDEDDMDKADEATMKARVWDEFKEANPRGSGNTLNKG